MILTKRLTLAVMPSIEFNATLLSSSLYGLMNLEMYYAKFVHRGAAVLIYKSTFILCHTMFNRFSEPLYC